MRLAVTVVLLTAATSSATFCCGRPGGTLGCHSHATPLARLPAASTESSITQLSRTRVMTMVHTTDELQLAAALVFPLLTYKVAAIVQRNKLQWYLDARIALVTASLLVYATS